MGEAAIDSILRGEMEEEQLNILLDGRMCLDDAFDLGLVDHFGSLSAEGTSIAQAREIETLEYCNRGLEHHSVLLSLSDGLQQGEPPQTSKKQHSVAAMLMKEFPRLSPIAIYNLSKESPTCNVCGNLMSIRNGKYGKFYYCKSACSGQSTVGFKYWKNLRDRLLKIVGVSHG